MQAINKIFISSTINNRILFSANIEQLKQHFLSFCCRQTSISVRSLWPPLTSLSVLPRRALQAAMAVLYQPSTKDSSNGPLQMDSFFPSWAHRERRYPSFLLVHDNQLSLQCNHQPSTFTRRSPWSSFTMHSLVTSQFSLQLLHYALSRHIPVINSVPF